MPADFEACRAAGGKIRTQTSRSDKGLKKGTYRHV